MHKNKILVYGTAWCGDCHRARSFLDKHKIDYEFINIDHNITCEKIVIELNGGLRIVPTIVFPDGSLLVEPSNQELAEKFKLEKYQD